MMRIWVRRLLALVLIPLAVAIQLAIFGQMRLPGQLPNLVLIVVVAFALVGGRESGMLLGFYGGILLDLAPPSNHPVGWYAIAFVAAGYVAGRLGEESRVPLPVGRAFIASTLALIVSALVIMVCFIMTGNPGFTLRSWTTSTIWGVVYAIVLTPFVVPLLVWAARKLTPRTAGP